MARDEGRRHLYGLYRRKKFCKGVFPSQALGQIGLHGSHVYDVFLDDVESGQGCWAV